MAEIFDNFIGGRDQIVTLVIVAVVWLGLSVLGAAIGGRERERYADPIFGWAVAALVFTLAGVFVALPFTFLAIGLALAAAGSAVFIYRRDGSIYPASALKMGLLAIPLILLSSAMVASQWDEFSHWLPSSRFLFESDAFPTAANPETGASFPAYPYGWPLMNYLSSRLAGRFVENTGGMFNVLLLLTFGLLIAKIIRRGLGDVAGRAPGWALIALGGLAVTLLNPTFVQKLVLTAYSDGPTAATVGFAGVLGWFMLDALAAGEKSRARRLALQMGLIMLVMINIRQANLVLFVMLTGGVAVAGWRDPTIRLAELARLLPLMIVPPLLIFLVWRFHVSSGLSGAEFTVGAVSDWLIGNIPEILARMLLILSKKGAYLVMALTAIGFGVAGFFRVRGSFDRLAIIVAFVLLGYNAFLLFAYVTTFGEVEGLRAASYWRYNTHVGLLALAFAAFGLAKLWHATVPARMSTKGLGWLAVVLIVAAPVIFSGKLRFDKEQPKPHFRLVATQLAAELTPGTSIIVLDPRGSGESFIITKFELGKTVKIAGFLSAFQDTRPERLRELMARANPTNILSHSVTQSVPTVFGADIEPGSSYLLGGGDGAWEIVKTWPHPAALRTLLATN